MFTVSSHTHTQTGVFFLLPFTVHLSAKYSPSLWFEAIFSRLHLHLVHVVSKPVLNSQLAAGPYMDTLLRSSPDSLALWKTVDSLSWVTELPPPGRKLLLHERWTSSVSADQPLRSGSTPPNCPLSSLSPLVHQNYKSKRQQMLKF